MKQHFQSDRWQHKYATAQERRESLRFTVILILAVLAVLGAAYFALSPGSLHTTIFASPMARR